jgi:hypothetical protein
MPLLLLRSRSEAKLAEAFDFLAGQLRSVHKLPVSYVALDWHQMDKELGSEALVEAFWTQLSALLPPQVRAGQVEKRRWCSTS